MSDQLNLQIVASLLLVTLYRRKQLNDRRKIKRKTWARKWLNRRDEGLGLSNMILKELKYEDPASFKNFTRMSVKTFQILLKKVEPFTIKQDTILREGISAKTRLLVTLRFLATGETFKSLHYSFRLSMASISVLVPETIKTPNTVQQWKTIADRFSNLWNFPNCLGALDGKHIAFRAKKEDGSFYYNYKGFHSIVLMALVDAEYNFIFVDVGCNGRKSDGGVFANSILSKAVEQNLWNFPEE